MKTIIWKKSAAITTKTTTIIKLNLLLIFDKMKLIS